MHRTSQFAAFSVGAAACRRRLPSSRMSREKQKQLEASCAAVHADYQRCLSTSNRDPRKCVEFVPKLRSCEKRWDFKRRTTPTGQRSQVARQTSVSWSGVCVSSLVSPSITASTKRTLCWSARGERGLGLGLSHFFCERRRPPTFLRKSLCVFRKPDASVCAKEFVKMRECSRPQGPKLMLATDASGALRYEVPPNKLPAFNSVSTDLGPAEAPVRSAQTLRESLENLKNNTGASAFDFRAYTWESLRSNPGQ